MSLIEDKEFDSNLFGYKVGFATISSVSQLNELKKSKYRLIYLTPENEEIYKQLIKNVGPCYENISLKAQVKPDLVIDEQIKSVLKSELSPDLYALTLQSGVYSRFNVDQNFKNNEYESLYKIWMQKSLDAIIADEVMAYYDQGKISGFITLSKKENACNIGLIAVDKDSRGKKVGSKLINSAHIFAESQSLSTLTVDTQKSNIPAVSFYERLNFSTYFLSKIFHFWNH